MQYVCLRPHGENLQLYILDNNLNIATAFIQQPQPIELEPQKWRQ